MGPAIRAWVVGAVMMVACCVMAIGWDYSPGSRPPWSEGRPPALAGAPPIIRQLHTDWVAHADRHHGKTPFAKAAGSFARLLHARAGRRELDECWAFLCQCAAAELEDPPGGYVVGFRTMVESSLFYELIQRGDRGRLITLLATVPMERAGWDYIEAALAVEHGSERVNARWTILFDAYAAASSERARAAIHAAIWRACGELPCPSRLDREEYIARCRAWYRSNADVLRVNRRADNPMAFGDLEGIRPGTKDVPPAKFLFELPSRR